MNREIKRLKPEDRPYVTNYPALEKYLFERDCRCMWQVPNGENYVEGWIIGVAAVILVVYPRRMGWNIYTALPTNDAVATFADVDKRCGFVSDHTFVPETDATDHEDDGCVALVGDDGHVCCESRSKHVSPPMVITGHRFMGGSCDESCRYPADHASDEGFPTPETSKVCGLPRSVHARQ